MDYWRVLLLALELWTAFARECWSKYLRPRQQFISHILTDLPKFIQNLHVATDKVSCSRTQHSDSAAGKVRTNKPSISSLTIYQLNHGWIPSCRE